MKFSILVLLLFLSVEVISQAKQSKTNPNEQFKRLDDSIYYYFENDFTKVDKLIHGLDKLIPLVTDSFSKIEYLKTKAYYYNYSNQKDTAVFLLRKAIDKIANSKTKDLKLIILEAKLHNVLAGIYHEAELYEMALNEHYKAIANSELVFEKEPKNQANNEFLSLAYAEAAATLSNTQKEQLTDLYFRKAIKFSMENSSAYIVGINLLNYGVFLLDIEKIDQADSVLQESFIHLQPIGTAIEMVALQINMSKISCLRGDYQIAEIKCIEALNMAREKGLSIFEIHALFTLLKIHTEQKKYSEALEVGFLAKQKANEAGSTYHIQRIELKLAELYEKLDNKQQQTVHLKRYIEIEDSLRLLGIDDALNSLSLKYQLEKTNAAYKFLENETIMQQKIIQNQKNQILIYWVFAGVAILIIFFISYLIFSIRKSNRKLLVLNENLLAKTNDLQELNETQNQLFAILSHDLRGPIGTSKMLFEIINTNHDELMEDEKKNLLKTIGISINSTFNLLENMLFWSKSRMNNLNLSFVQIDVYSLVNDLISSIDNTIFTKEITISNNIGKDLIVSSSDSILTIILRNIVTNAIKYTKRGGRIEIQSIKLNDFIEISIEDNGIGISAERLNTLLASKGITSNMGTESEGGSGIGLMISNELLKKIKGQIEIESELGVGTKVKIRLPLEV